MFNRSGGSGFDVKKKWVASRWVVSALTKPGSGEWLDMTMLQA
jgi:hypothetical protein